MERYLNNDFWHKREMDHFDPYNVVLAIATNIPQRLNTAFVLQRQILAHKTRGYQHRQKANI